MESAWPERDQLWRHLWKQPRGTRDGNSGMEEEQKPRDTGKGFCAAILKFHFPLLYFTPRGIPTKNPQQSLISDAPGNSHPSQIHPGSPSHLPDPRSRNLGWVSSLLQGFFLEKPGLGSSKPTPGTRDLLLGKSNPAKGEILGVPDLGRSRARTASQSPG